MKKTFIFLFLGILFISKPIYSQGFCDVEEGYNEYNDIILNSSYKNVDLLRYKFCIRVHIHVIRRTNGTGGQTPAKVNTAMSFMNAAYNPHDIYFYRIGGIHYIDNDAIFNSPYTPIFNDTYDLPNGVNIYLGDDSMNYSWGMGGGYSPDFNTTVVPKFAIRGTWTDGSSLTTSHVMSHEMGHNLFLYHTHYGTSGNNPNDPNDCPECADGSNGIVCGDYVQDTPADPHLQWNVNPTTCQWNGSGISACGSITPYNPDELNLMSYTIPSCMQYITQGQANRAKIALLEFPFLQNVSSYTWNGSYPCPSIGTPILSMYPNPADTFVRLDLTENEEGNYTYRILNLYGEVFISGNCSNELVELNVSQLSSGLYVVQVTSEGGTTAKNLIIQ